MKYFVQSNTAEKAVEVMSVATDVGIEECGVQGMALCREDEAFRRSIR